MENLDRQEIRERIRQWEKLGSIQDLFGLIATADEDLKREIWQALNRINYEDFFEFLVASLQNPHAPTRLNAVKGLAKLRDPRSIEHLMMALMEDDEKVRSEIIKTLALIQGGHVKTQKTTTPE